MKRLIFSCFSCIYARAKYLDSTPFGIRLLIHPIMGINLLIREIFYRISVFEEVGLFNLDSCKKYTFKKLNDRWYLKFENKW